MKKYIFSAMLMAVLVSCNDGKENNNAADDTMKTNAAANDSTQTPNGVTTGSVISTNPDATKTKTSQPGDSTQPR